MGSTDTIPECARQPGRHRRNTTNIQDVIGRATPVRLPVARTRHTRPLVGPVGETATDPRLTSPAGRDPAGGAAPKPGNPSPANPLADTGPIGLRMFNLGTIPASVTPPRSWRRAAWFTIAASVAALLGLLTLGALLVGPVRGTDRISAMPYFPSGAPLPALGGPSSPPSANGHARPAPPHSGVDRVTNVGDVTPLVPHRPAPVVLSAPADGSTAPVVATLPTGTPVAGAEPGIDPGQLLQRTQTFFASVTSDVPAAVELTATTVPDDAFTLINRKYGEVSSIDVRSITLDPANGMTVSVLRMVYKDGTAADQQTTLYFTSADDPKIVNPGG